MFISNIEGIPVKNKIDIKCDKCAKVFSRRISGIKQSRKQRNSNKDFCCSCAAKLSIAKKPQCTKDFWKSTYRKEMHGNAMKASSAWINSIKNRPSIVGENNPMYGKKHTTETKKKMSISRTGKTGENATAWKGGKKSLNSRIKRNLQRKFKWFHCVMDRDSCECQHCGADNKLDAHHIEPLSLIIKRLLLTIDLLTESEKIDWLLKQPEIIDNDLKNGLTLCRTCHKKVHLNWGSHEPKIR